jgi:hypothetical protein
LKVIEKVGFKRAAVAVARTLAVIMHSMLKTGQAFDRSIGFTEHDHPATPSSAA